MSKTYETLHHVNSQNSPIVIVFYRSVNRGTEDISDLLQTQAGKWWSHDFTKCGLATDFVLWTVIISFPTLQVENGVGNILTHEVMI